MKVSYTAGADGFKVLSNDLPVAPVFDGKAPEPVQDTAEVKKAKEEHAKLVKESKREKRQIWGGLPYAYNYKSIVAPVAYSAPVAYTAPIAYSAPVVAKSTINTVVLEKDEKAKTPADTNKLTEKIISRDVYTPIAAAPYYAAYPTYGWPVAAIQADKPKEEKVESDDESIKVESARKKRQVLALPYNYIANYKPEEFKNDFDYSSVDLNQDGQPDNKPFYYPLAYRTALPYATTYGAYPFVY